MKWYLKVLNQYADFSGRARREEFWMFELYNVIISFFLGIFCFIFFDLFYHTSATSLFNGIIILYSLAILIPRLAVTIRRLHDVNASGWMLFVLFIPLIGQIWILVLLFTEGNKGSNKYGPNPK